MPSDLVREIAEAIFREQLLENWRFHAILLCVAVVGGAASSWIGPYLKRRAETHALKTDMQEILRQLAETTRTTEQVRVAVNQTDWAQREWRALRRTKLEELLSTAYSLDQWLEGQQDRWLHASEKKPDPLPMDRLKMIGALYFPELMHEVTAVWMTHQSALMFILEVGGPGGQARMAKDSEGYGKAMAKFREGWAPHYTSARAAISALERAASALMVEVAGA